ncbi:MULTISPECIES: hypothetical protein [unclassified Shewanella]|uniref:hypothetical protein n=1 Tax=unclassified Shewanella TaxID=196818 RepID=UPI001C5A88BD|nr:MULTISPECIES: hypothetical protein [unclassified Shewanella]MBW3513770.1 hypothetical protein [Shewanella sp. NKUCC01_JLK]
MKFMDEVKQIKLTNENNIFEARSKRELEEVADFKSRIQGYIDNIEKIKNDILDAVRKGSEKHTIISHIFDVAAPIFNSTETKIFAHITSDEPCAKERRLKMMVSLLQGVNDNSKADEITSVISKESYRYECVRPSLLTSEYHSQGFNQKWYFIDTKAGKSVILDKKLIELWELLESLGLRPFFSGDIHKVDLCVHC